MTEQPTPRQIALAVAALKAWCYTRPASDNTDPVTHMASEWFSRVPGGAIPELFDSPIFALAAAAEALGLEPDPQVWGNHLRVRVQDAHTALFDHYIDCPKLCSGTGATCPERDELRDAAERAQTLLLEFSEQRGKADG